MRKIRLWHRSDATIGFGKYALVDNEDYQWLVEERNWNILQGSNGSRLYAAGTKKSPLILMHRRILGIEDRAVKVDHINGNGLDNRRQNLRFATTSQNGMNSPGVSQTIAKVSTRV